MNLDRPALDQAEVNVLSDRGVDLWPECAVDCRSMRSPDWRAAFRFGFALSGSPLRADDRRLLVGGVGRGSIRGNLASRRGSSPILAETEGFEPSIGLYNPITV